MLQNDLFRHVNRWASSADIFKSQRHQINKVKQWVQKLPFVHWVHCRAVFQASLLDMMALLHMDWRDTHYFRPECCCIIRNIANDSSSRNKIQFSSLFMWSRIYIHTYTHITRRCIYLSSTNYDIYPFEKLLYTEGLECLFVCLNLTFQILQRTDRVSLWLRVKTKMYNTLVNFRGTHLCKVSCAEIWNQSIHNLF